MPHDELITLPNLTVEEFQTLLIMMGMATAAARQIGQPLLALSFVRLANTINRDNPNWTPYVMPEEKVRQEDGTATSKL